MRYINFIILLVVLSGCDAKVAVKPAPTTPVVAPPVQPPIAPQPERVVADTGVGAKGRDYGGGMITEPVKQYWRVQERLIFTQIEQAMGLYKAGNDNKAPASHEAFMKEIIEANNIKLPMLPPGEKYIYDPATEQLMVERPRKT